MNDRIFKLNVLSSYPFNPVKTENEIEIKRSQMHQKGIVLSIDDCEVVGISGGCGKKCPVFLRGDCTEPELLEEK